MFDTLSERLRKTLGTLTGRGRISEADVDAAMREVRLALLEADVNFKVVKDFVARVRERAIGHEVLESLSAGQQVVKIVNDELVALLSAGDRTFHLSGNPAVVAMVGLQGSGKTTSTAKLARHVVKLGRRPLLVAADPYRPAAADQLETLGKSLDIPVYRAPAGTPVVDIVRGGVEAAKRQVRDVVILDTAGRLSRRRGADGRDRGGQRRGPAGRDAARRRRDDRPGGRRRRPGVRGRGARHRPDPDEDRRRRPRRRGAVHLAPSPASRSSSSAPARRPTPSRSSTRTASPSRILGMGDILTLVERAQEHVDQKQAAKLEEKMRKGAFTLDDMLDSMQQMQKMGPLGQVMSMIPGMGNLAGEAQAAVDRGDLKRTEGDHPGHDPLRATRSDDPQQLASSADRRRLGHDPARRQPAREAIPRDAEAHEAALRAAASAPPSAR